MKNKKAISLIVLVITIIVMIILAGAIIISLSNTNIFNKAEEAVDKYTDVQLKQEINIIFANAQLEKYINNNYSIENELKKLFENKYGKDNVTAKKSGKNYKVELKDSKTVIRVKADGSIEEYELMEPTNVYARLDDEGTLYLRATEKEGYNSYLNYTSIQPDWNTAGDASNYSVNKVIIEEMAPISTSSMFANYYNLTEIQNIKNLHTENAKSMSYMFAGCNSLKEIDVSSFDTSSVNASIGSMFLGCKLLTKIDVTNFDTTNVTKMDEMFNGCNSLIELDVSGFSTSNVIQTFGMFNGCTSLANIDVSNFDTANITKMGAMFCYCKSLKNIDISNFDTSNAQEIGYLFYGCSGLTNIDISNFDTSKATKINRMFEGCTNLKNLKLGNKFVINEGANFSNMLDNVPSDIKIIATEATRDKMISVSTLTNSNFEIIN